MLRLLSVVCLLFSAFSYSEINNQAIANPDQDGGWYSYGRTYSEQRFSPERAINDQTVSKLSLDWSLELPSMKSLNATPLVVDGVMYFSGTHSVVIAVNALTGAELWRYDPKSLAALQQNRRQETMMSWGTSRGIAFWKGRVFVGTADGRLIAIDAKTGVPVWVVQTTAIDGPLGITGAPRVFNDTVIIGNGGSEFGPVRGYVTAYDTETGKQRWRFYSVPGNPADGFENKAMAMAAKTWKGEWWKHGGGGTVWNAITYDPEYNRVYLGTGNGAPWNQKIRSPGGGDNLFLCAIVALDADTGEYIWHYQTNPGETWDYNSAMDIMLADLELDQQQRKVIMHAPKNGFFYVIDRDNGKVISAEKFSKVTWAERIDLTTGRPVEDPSARYMSEPALVWPSGYGAHNWHAMSYSPNTGLVYIPTQEIPSLFDDSELDLEQWQSSMFRWSVGTNKVTEDFPADIGSSSLLAWDPVKQQKAWEKPLPGAWNGGTLATAGNLVFQGTAAGHLVAYRADSGKELWRFPVGVGISAPPISYSINGKQYISVLAGWGGATYFGLSLFAQHGWEYGVHTRRLLTFSLQGSATLPPFAAPLTALQYVDNPKQVIDEKKAARGKSAFAETCFYCHGYGMVAGGGAPDLRASTMAANKALFQQIVKGGLLQQRGMPAFSGFSDQRIDDLYEYIRWRARESANASRAVQPQP
ncbi:PQQ-dependent dehydrogenase, methanol/ethanol family [Oceanicoccus sagamiensis]|uniref:PQQ-dependent dehydrogenase, methanol/ethanol family n=1 Tax=Oceanicoccus sagamiensis TaxID=716816 RepID=A0A1X9NJL1_9GAMM|nr:PQQ-dependent dehydrogenase, methanol/ethanol family [Oceanicoccus sagamiensis]ARN75659.1 PQQ-dependent dehydrogenase, methanol/ethanol family [Oceanicoccus sagamiensis]